MTKMWTGDVSDAEPEIPPRPDPAPLSETELAAWEQHRGFLESFTGNKPDGSKLAMQSNKSLSQVLDDLADNIVKHLPAGGSPDAPADVTDQRAVVVSILRMTLREEGFVRIEQLAARQEPRDAD